MKKNRLGYILLIMILVIPTVVFADNDQTCTGILGSPDDPNATAYYLQLALNIMRYAAVVALVVMSSLDYIKALIAQNNDAIKKANITFLKRLAYCVLIFFVPLVVKFIMEIVGVYGTCGVQ